jgi:hypothetical protein
MLTDGFVITDPEYIAAQLYFSQEPQPQSLIVGRQDGTAIGAATPGAGGTNYVVGDVVTVTQTGASFGQLKVTTISTGGVVTGLATITNQQGTGYSVASGLATTGGSGTGLTVNITSIGESALQAFQACRAASGEWYCGMMTTAADADHEAIAAWVNSQVGTVYLGTTSSAGVLSGAAGNVLKIIYGASSKRTWMQYATTQGGLLPTQAYFVAAVMGQAMASNTQLANSSFTEKFSGGVQLIGVYTEPNLTPTQIANIEGSTPGQGPNGNLFLNYANAFNILEQGTMMAENAYFDQILGLDVLASAIQYAVLNVLTSNPKVPQSDAGQQMLIQAVESACAQSATTGFIAPGIWQGQNIINQITKGMAMPTGYAVVSPLYSTLTQAQIQARQAPPIYVALIEAGAVHFVTVEVLVQV